MAGSQTSSSRNLTLDVLRAVAVLLVLGRHMPRIDIGVVVGDCLRLWAMGGWIGVDLFFVLSGFLVSGLLFQEYKRRQTLSVGRFLVRRGLKIYPSFYVLVLITLAVGVVQEGRLPRSASILLEVFFLQNYGHGLWNYTWSLAVEEHFYLLLPLVLVSLVWRRRGAADPFGPVPVIFLAVAGVCLGLRILAVARTPFALYTHLFPTHLRLDSLMMGVVVAYAWHFRQAWFQRVLAPRRFWLVAVGLALLSPAFLVRLNNPWMHTVGLTGLYLGSAALLCGMLMIPLPAFSGLRVLAFFGAHSYSIYLWHLPLRNTLLWLERTFAVDLGFWPRLSLYLAGSLLWGVVMAKIIEIPFVRLRDRWYPSRTAAPIESAPPPATIQTAARIAA